MLPVQRNLQSAAVIHASETQVGCDIDVGMYSRLTLFFEYTKGDETGVYVRVGLLGDEGWDEYPLGTWTDAAGTLTFGASKWYLTATGNASVQLDIRGYDVVRVYEQANGGTPSGTLSVKYTLV